MNSGIALVIPAYNAGRSLSELLGRSSRFIPPEATIVIDDGSTDDTESIARLNGAMVLRHDRNRGKGAALRTGFDRALTDGWDAVISMDADLQHEPESIPAFLEAYDSRQYDVIIGSRRWSEGGMPVHRILSNSITSALVRARTRTPLSDSQSGFRLIDIRVLRTVRTETLGFEAETEFILKAAAAGFRFGSVPVRTIYNGHGSHMTNVATTLKFIKVILRDY